jgi:hypothetical protein
MYQRWVGRGDGLADLKNTEIENEIRDGLAESRLITGAKP